MQFTPIRTILYAYKNKCTTKEFFGYVKVTQIFHKIKAAEFSLQVFHA